MSIVNGSFHLFLVKLTPILIWNQQIMNRFILFLNRLNVWARTLSYE